jgi:hypothetical protein
VWNPNGGCVCVGTGEVRPERLIIDVAELTWEPLIFRSNGPPDAS